MPGWLRLFVQLNPVSSMTTAMRGLMGGGLTLSQVGYALLAPALLTLVLAPLLIAVSIWLYTLVFAFSCLWFVHYLLAALHLARGRVTAPVPAAPVSCRPSRSPRRAESLVRPLPWLFQLRP
mgnify:CR=1 FL=1